jgi:CBS domain-containing protein
MGYQLWTSPVTGYRRKGTRLSELRSALATSVTARTILEPIQSCPKQAPVTEVRDLLRERGFDIAGVMEKEKGPVIGFVVTEELTGETIQGHMKPLQAEHLISDATPTSDLLRALRVRQRTFVLVGSEVKGIVTVADLNKPPIRVYLFGLVSLLEMHLRFWIRGSYAADSWKEKLSAPRLEAAEKLHAERERRNEQIDLLDCLQFCDNRDLLLSNEKLRKKLEIESKSKGEELLNDIERLRNRLAHSQLDLVEGTSWQELIDVIEKMEALIHRSDDAVEREALSSKKDGPGLWTVS